MSNETDPVSGSDLHGGAALQRAEDAVLAELSSPEAVKAFAFIRNQLRPGETNRFSELPAADPLGCTQADNLLRQFGRNI